MECSAVYIDRHKLPYGSVLPLRGAMATLFHCDHLPALRIQFVQANAKTNKVVNTPAGFLVDVTCSLPTPQGGQ